MAGDLGSTDLKLPNAQDWAESWIEFEAGYGTCERLNGSGSSACYAALCGLHFNKHSPILDGFVQLVNDTRGFFGFDFANRTIGQR